MQELVGAAVWCLIPYDSSPQTGPGRGRSGWKIIFASPATHELLGYKPEEVEGNDWADFVYRECQTRRLTNFRSDSY
jgi:PAS domain-containing protein